MIPRRIAQKPPPPERRRLILVVFGGGTRFSESIGDPEHRYIPRLWREMVPRARCWRTCGSSIAWSTQLQCVDQDGPLGMGRSRLVEAARASDHLRDRTQASRLARHGRLAFVYASILANTGCSSAAGYGRPFAANVVEPPTIPRTVAEEMDRRLVAARATGSPDIERQAAAECARLARSASRIATDGLQSDAARRWLDERYQAWRQADGTTSHDAFLADCACQAMERFSPHVLSVDFGEIDCAHYGSWSRYLEAIGRTDALTWRLWQTAERLPGYRGATLMLILPDHGRELEREGGSGFIHHSDFYTNQGADEGCRRTWMLAVGPGVALGGRSTGPCRSPPPPRRVSTTSACPLPRTPLRWRRSCYRVRSFARCSSKHRSRVLRRTVACESAQAIIS